MLIVGASACVAACGADGIESGQPATTQPEAYLSISVADGCATVTDPASDEPPVVSCVPPASSPVYAWGTDLPEVSVNLIRLPGATEIERVERADVNTWYDSESGWFKIEYRDEQPLVFLSQNDEIFRCELQFAGLVCAPS